MTTFFTNYYRKKSKEYSITLLSNSNIILTNKHFFNYFNYHCVYVSRMIIQPVEKLVGNLYMEHEDSSIACAKCDSNGLGAGIS